MIKNFFIFAVLVVALAACASRLNNDNLTKVKNGMSEVDVKGILGSPAKIETGETLGIRGTTYYYKAGDSEVKIVFLNGSVMAKEGSFQ